jgi:virginiamycin B lyase
VTRPSRSVTVAALALALAISTACASAAHGESGAIAAAADGGVWFAQPSADEIGHLTTAGRIERFRIPTPAAEPAGLAIGTDGSLWFSEHRAGEIGRIEPGGAIREYPVPVPPARALEPAFRALLNPRTPGPGAIAAGSDGSMWFTEGGDGAEVSGVYGGQIAKITPSGTIEEYPIPSPNSEPQAITTASDGEVAFAERTARGGAIGRVASDGTIRLFPLPEGGEADGIATGPAGALWFTEIVFGPGAIVGQIGLLAQSGAISDFPMPRRAEQPSEIAPGGEGGVWFPTFASTHITRGPDGSLSTGPTTGVLARMDAQGHVREFVTRHDVLEIAPGTDGSLWFTQQSSNAIGHIDRSGRIVELPTKTRSRRVKRAPLAVPPAPSPHRRAGAHPQARRAASAPA